jgi:CBS domain containing-hemolysin-like protein
MLHAEELMQMVLEDTDFSRLPPEEILHPIIMVPPTKKVDEMFDFFLAHNAQAAVVLNEFGGIDGLITLKNVVNYIFGHASSEEPITSLFSEPEPGVFEIDGAMKLTDFNAITNYGIEDNRMTTISGVLLRHLDRLPSIGDEVTVEGVCLKVLSLEGHRITRLSATTTRQAAKAGGEIIEPPESETGPVDEGNTGSPQPKGDE